MVYKWYKLPIGWYTTYQLVRERETAIDVFPIHLEKNPRSVHAHQAPWPLLNARAVTATTTFTTTKFPSGKGFTSLDHLSTQIAINSINLNWGHLREDSLTKSTSFPYLGWIYKHELEKFTRNSTFSDRYSCCCWSTFIGRSHWIQNESVEQTRKKHWPRAKAQKLAKNKYITLR